MNLFHRAPITVHCASRSTSLAVPDRDRLLDACEPRQRRALQHWLAKHPDDAPSWSLDWRKTNGDELRAQDVVAVLRADQVTVELVYLQKGTLAETLVAQDARVAAGTALARLERRAKPAPAPEPPPEPPAEALTRDLVRRYVSQQRSDAATIQRLETDLASSQQMAERLRREVHVLQARLVPGRVGMPDAKFRRLKHEFSKHFHPDAPSLGGAERELRKRVFQEFWPIVEEIDRS